MGISLCLELSHVRLERNLRDYAQQAKMAAIFLQFLTVALFTHGGWAASVDDRILQPGANGTSVVLLTVAHIQQTTVFADDNGMLRRIAYVETRDGTRPSDSIWRVDQDALLRTQILEHPTLNVKHNLISQEFAIDWTSVELEDLKRPLYSAIAARLLLFIAPERLPDANDIEGQALLWKRYYNENGSVAEFTGAAYELEGKYCRMANTVTNLFMCFSCTSGEYSL